MRDAPPSPIIPRQEAYLAPSSPRCGAFGAMFTDVHDLIRHN